MRRIILIVFIFIVPVLIKAVPYQINAGDTFLAYKASSAVIIDGLGSEAFWDEAEWYPLEDIWLPYNDVVDAADFTGRFKISWTGEKLLLLVEVTDDSLFDGHADPLQNYWDDDCVEVFVDEDHSGGNHLNNYNAFAYHVSTFYDVVDNGTTGPLLFNDHIEAAWTRQGNEFIWELAINIYDDTYVENGTNTPVTLVHNKVMGFSLAYCDNDGSSSRENFIGSKYLPQNQSNNSYIDASIFGTLVLKDKDAVSRMNDLNESGKWISFLNLPGEKQIQYTFKKELPVNAFLTLRNLSGQILCSKKIESEIGVINTKNFPQGIYLFEIHNPSTLLSNGKIFLE